MHSTYEQNRAIRSYIHKNLVVIASAGTGKSTVLIERVKFLLENGIPANKILLTSFTLKSCEDLKKKVSKVSSEVTVSNIHKIAYRICSRYLEGIKVIDAKTQRKIVSDIMKETEGNTQQ